MSGETIGMGTKAVVHKGLLSIRMRTHSRESLVSNESIVKKPTRKRKEWNRRHAQDLFVRKLAHQRYLKVKRCGESSRRTKGLPEDKSHFTVSIDCPRTMSLAENFDGVTKLLDRIRQYGNRQRNENMYINFKEIKEISPGAALVVAAELDRWNHVPHHRGRKLRAVDVEEWDKHVRHRLEDMGFFDLLHVRVREDDESEFSGTKYIRFRSGKQVEGKAIEDLRMLDLEPFFGGSVPRRRRLYAAVTEAMTNVVHHAYRDNVQTPRPNWWLSASHNAQTGEIRILLYDQGAGIPITVPKKFAERVQRMISPTDADMIRVAHELTRTASGEEHRGHGLQRDVRKYVETVDCISAYRVTSLRGQYTWKRGANGRTQESTHNFGRPLPGTLIEWRLTLQ